MHKEKFETQNAPAAVGPYSQAIRTGDFLFLSGQIGIDPTIKRIVDGGIEAQAHQVLKNVSAVLENVGLSMDHVVKTTVFLKDMTHFKIVNDIYSQYFKSPFPARSAIAVQGLPLSAEIEIEAIATF